jgi:hypothetical protein
MMVISKMSGDWKWLAGKRIFDKYVKYLNLFLKIKTKDLP